MSNLNLYFTMHKMKKHIMRVKKYNKVAKVAALDIGRIYIGLAISDPLLLKARPFDTQVLQTGLSMNTYPTIRDEFNINSEFFKYLTGFIRNLHVKGLIIGYPLQDPNKPERHTQFIENLVKHMFREGLITIPVTFINEEFSTVKARKLIFLEQVIQKNFDKNLVDRKKLQDKTAAGVILERFLEYYHELDKDKQGNEIENDKENNKHNKMNDKKIVYTEKELKLRSELKKSNEDNDNRIKIFNDLIKNTKL